MFVSPYKLQQCGQIFKITALQIDAEQIGKCVAAIEPKGSYTIFGSKTSPKSC